MDVWLLRALAITIPVASAVLGPTGANNASTPTVLEGNRTIHYVTVGKTTNEFVPNSIVAKIGDIVSFQFYPLNHSVIRSAYGWPCIPIEDSPYEGSPFFSGFFPVDDDLRNPPTWNITVNTTQPVWYYCGAPGSCIDWGMLGVINADAATSIETQISLARHADVMLLPGQTFPSEQAEASFSKLAHSATATTRTTQTITTTASSQQTSVSSMCMSTSGSSCDLSSGVVAGIAVGAAAGALIIAAVFFLLYRTRRLKEKLQKERASTAAGKLVESDSSSPVNGPSNERDPHLSGLSTYRVSTFHPQPDGNRGSRSESWTANNMQMSMQSPHTSYEPRFTRLASPHLSQNFRDSNASAGSIAELDVRRSIID